MKWTRPQHGTARVTAAGKVISGRRTPTEQLNIDAAFDIAANWRSSHGYPLHVLYTTLRNRARTIDPNALVAQRLKRMPSVIAKLKRFSGMQLSQMQDLGGCRAVVKTIKEVDTLVSLYDRKPCKAALFCEKYDHIKIPKPDGYRGVHFVYRYRSKHENRDCYDGLRIEVQIRSIYQHAWACAVETIDTFTDQALKSGVGDPAWQRFFLLISSFIAAMEDRPVVLGTPSAPEWFPELRSLVDRLNVTDTLEGLRTGLKIVGRAPVSEAYILILNRTERKTTVLGFNDSDGAAMKYAEIERDTINSPHIQAVMVSVDSVGALQQAYPNYYLDTARFLGILQGFMSYDEEQPT